MTAAANRASTYGSVSAGSDGKNGDQKKDLWTSLLEDTKGKSGKKLAEKNLIVLGMDAGPDADRRARAPSDMVQAARPRCRGTS